MFEFVHAVIHSLDVVGRRASWRNVQCLTSSPFGVRSCCALVLVSWGVSGVERGVEGFYYWHGLWKFGKIERPRFARINQLTDDPFVHHELTASHDGSRDEFHDWLCHCGIPPLWYRCVREAAPFGVPLVCLAPRPVSR